MNILIHNQALKSNSTSSVISILALIFLLVLSSCSGSDNDKPGKDKETEETCDNSSAEGYRTLEEDSKTREYILHLPASYNSDTPSPLVINFHGFGDCAASHAENVGTLTGLNAVADSENFIVVYPQGVVREKGSAYWEPGDSGSEDIVENDVYFTKQLIAELNSAYNVDVSRVYAVGYSNGGMMAYDLACVGSDFIAAIGVMSGISLSETCAIETAYTSVIHFHGIEDEVLPYEGNESYQSVSNVVNYWLGHNNISPSSLVSTELDDGDVQRDEYTGGSENTSVVLYTVNREFDKAGGHVWFSEDIDGANPNQILWDFLSNYSL